MSDPKQLSLAFEFDAPDWREQDVIAFLGPWAGKTAATHAQDAPGSAQDPDADQPARGRA
jgi:hypothetical protein